MSYVQSIENDSVCNFSRKRQRRQQKYERRKPPNAQFTSTKPQITLASQPDDNGIINEIVIWFNFLVSLLGRRTRSRDEPKSSQKARLEYLMAFNGREIPRRRRKNLDFVQLITTNFTAWAHPALLCNHQENIANLINRFEHSLSTNVYLRLITELWFNSPSKSSH